MMRRTFVTYTTESHVNYLAMSLFTLGATHVDIDVVVLVDDERSPALRALAQGADRYRVPVEIRPVDTLSPFLDQVRFERLIHAYMDRLPSRSLLFSDLIRSALPAAFGKPVVWFDADMLFLGSITSALPNPAEGSTAAAPDTLLLAGDREWINAHERFVAGVGKSELPEESRQPANIGLLALGRDCRDAYLFALERALPVVCDDPLEATRYAVGQQAWNLLLWEEGGDGLDPSLNTPSAVLGDLEDHADVLVRHYLGPGEKKRMTVDFVQGLLHGVWRDDHGQDD